MTTMNIYDLTDTWNAGGTTFNAIKMNVTDTASAAGSLLMDLQVGGASKFSISKAGSVLAPIGSAAAPTFAFGVSNTGWYSSGSGSIVDLSIGGTQNLRFSSNGMFFPTAAGTVQVSSGGSFSFSSGTAGAASADTILARDAANTLAQRNGTNAQAFRIYNTFTDASNYERGFARWVGNVFEIGAEGVGTGAPRTVKITTNSGVVELFDGNSVWFITSGLMSIGTRSIAGMTNVVGQSGYTEMAEMTAPAAPAANKVRIYAVDNGSGKTQLMALFATGAAQQIAIEP